MTPWDYVVRFLLRRLGVLCGAHGGGDDYAGKGRWCRKPFGHIDSCAYDNCLQPLLFERQRWKGWLRE